MSVDTILSISIDERFAIKKSFGKSDADVAKDIRQLREWLQKQPHLPQDTDNNQLERVLRMNKFSIEKTKTKLDFFYSIRNLVPEFYDDRDIFSPRMQFHMDNIIATPLPKLTDDHSRVHIFAYENDNPDNFDISIHAKLIFAAGDIRYFYDDCVSEIYIIDLKNSTLAHALKHTPALLKKAHTVIQKAYSERIKGIHYINLPNSALILVNLTNAILKEKLAKRVFVHKDLASLHKEIPKSVLPPEYGGTEKPLAEINAEWRKILENNNKWLMEIAQKRSNEKLRIGTPLDTDIFGSIHGSFRQLNVD